MAATLLSISDSSQTVVPSVTAVAGADRLLYHRVRRPAAAVSQCFPTMHTYRFS